MHVKLSGLRIPTDEEVEKVSYLVVGAPCAHGVFLTSSMKGVYPLLSLLASTSIFFSTGRAKNARVCSNTCALVAPHGTSPITSSQGPFAAAVAASTLIPPHLINEGLVDAVVSKVEEPVLAARLLQHLRRVFSLHVHDWQRGTGLCQGQ